MTFLVIMTLLVTMTSLVIMTFLITFDAITLTFGAMLYVAMKIARRTFKIMAFALVTFAQITFGSDKIYHEAVLKSVKVGWFYRLSFKSTSCSGPY